MESFDKLLTNNRRNNDIKLKEQFQRGSKGVTAIKLQVIHENDIAA